MSLEIIYQPTQLSFLKTLFNEAEKYCLMLIVAVLPAGYSSLSRMIIRRNPGGGLVGFRMLAMQA